MRQSNTFSGSGLGTCVWDRDARPKVRGTPSGALPSPRPQQSWQPTGGPLRRQFPARWLGGPAGA